MGIRSSQSWLGSLYLHFARLLQFASLFRCFSVTFFLQLHKPVLPDKVCSPAEEEGKEGSSKSKWEGKTNSRGREIPCHKRLIVGLYKRKKNDPGSVV